MIRVGGTYVYGDPDDDHFVFVVVEDTSYVNPDGSVERPGFRCLVVCGEFDNGLWMTPAGSHFVAAAGSAIACGSVRFPDEE